MKTFGEILKEKRKEKGYTQPKLAKKLGVSLQIIWCWENGKHFPNLMVAADIADLFGCTIDELLDRKVKP